MQTWVTYLGSCCWDIQATFSCEVTEAAALLLVTRTSWKFFLDVLRTVQVLRAIGSAIIEMSSRRTYPVCIVMTAGLSCKMPSNLLFRDKRLANTHKCANGISFLAAFKIYSRFALLRTNAWALFTSTWTLYVYCSCSSRVVAIFKEGRKESRYSVTSSACPEMLSLPPRAVHTVERRCFAVWLKRNHLSWKYLRRFAYSCWFNYKPSNVNQFAVRV